MTIANDMLPSIVPWRLTYDRAAHRARTTLTPYTLTGPCGPKEFATATQARQWAERHGHKEPWKIAARLAQAAPKRACLDMPGDREGGRIVVAGEWLNAQRPPLPLDIIGAALRAMANNHTYRSPNGAWSLTPLED